MPAAPDISAPPCLETRPYKACPTSPKARGVSGSMSAPNHKSCKDRMLAILTGIREPLAEHQAGQGLGIDE